MSGTRLSGELVIAKLASASTLDPTFGTAGVVTLKPASHPVSDRLLVLPDGRVLLIGRTTGGGMFFARFLANGTPDPSFGKNG